MKPKYLVAIAILIIAACTGQTDSAQQIITCPISALPSDQTELTRDVCIEKLVAERDSFHSQLKRSTAAEARLLIQVQEAAKMAEAALLLNEKEKWLTLCLNPFPEVIALDAQDIRQELIDSRRAYRKCDPELVVFSLIDEKIRARDYPNIAVTEEEVQKQIGKLIHRKLQALYAAITMEEGYTPELFCDGECEVKGRYELVDELDTTLEANNLEPEYVEKELTSLTLTELRTQGIREFFDLWALSDHSSHFKVQGKSRLCFEFEMHPGMSGLDETELTELNCGEHGQ